MRNLKKAIAIARRHGIAELVQATGPALHRKAKRLRIQAQRLRSEYHAENCRKWALLENRYAGKRAFLIGNGPSLNRTPLHLLESEHTICFNRFNLMFERLSWRPTMYMNVDPLVATDMAAEIDQIVPQVEHAFLPDHHYDLSGYFRGQVQDRENIYWLYEAPMGPFHRPPRFSAAGSVASAGLQVLVYMGFDPIYLIGVDLNYRIHETAVEDDVGGIVSTADDDPNHFDPRYFGTGRNYHQPDAAVVRFQADTWARLKRQTDRMGKRIVNAGVGGALDLFRRVDLRELLAPSRVAERAAIDRAVRRITGGMALEEVLARARTISGAQEWNSEEAIVVADQSTGLEVIKEALFSHVPVGPFEGLYLFIRR